MEISFVSLNPSQVLSFLFLFFIVYFLVLFCVCLFYFVAGFSQKFLDFCHIRDPDQKF